VFHEGFFGRLFMLAAALLFKVENGKFVYVTTVNP